MPDEAPSPDEPLSPVDGPPSPADRERETAAEIGELEEFEENAEALARIDLIRAEAKRAEAEADRSRADAEKSQADAKKAAAEADKSAADAEKVRAEAEKIKAETELARVRRDQAKDDRKMRVVAAGATFLLVAGWLWWMSDLIMLNSYAGAKRKHFTAETVQVALIVNAAVALIGLFAVILRGLFQAPKDEAGKKD